MEYVIKEERLTAFEYIDFLKHSDLGNKSENPRLLNCRDDS